MATAPIRQRIETFLGAAAALPPKGVQGAASQLGGSVARGLNQGLQGVGSQLQKVGLQKQGEGLQNFGKGVMTFQKAQQAAKGIENISNLTGSQALGYVGMGLGLGGAFVGGMGANAGVNSLAAYFSQDNTLRQAQGGTYGSGAMPQDLQRGYISLNQFGSPLGLMNIQHDANVQRARYNQGLLRASVGPQFNQVEE